MSKDKKRSSTETARRIWLAGIGAYGRAFTEAQEAIKDVTGKSSDVFDDLVQKGEMIEMVVAEKRKDIVKKADKEGNDQADAAAGKGSKEAQESLASLVATYSSKHKRYEALLERIHASMLKMSKHEKDERQKWEQALKVKSFAEGTNVATKKGREKILSKNLTYAAKGQGRCRKMQAV